MKRIYKKDFTIKGHRTGNRIRGHENEVEYIVYTADGTKAVQGGFYRKADADKWLSKNVRLANQLLAEGRI